MQQEWKLGEHQMRGDTCRACGCTDGYIRSTGAMSCGGGAQPGPALPAEQTQTEPPSSSRRQESGGGLVLLALIVVMLMFFFDPLRWPRVPLEPIAPRRN